MGPFLVELGHMLIGCGRKYLWSLVPSLVFGCNSNLTNSNVCPSICPLVAKMLKHQSDPAYLLWNDGGSSFSSEDYEQIYNLTNFMLTSYFSFLVSTLADGQQAVMRRAPDRALSWAQHVGPR